MSLIFLCTLYPGVRSWSFTLWYFALGLGDWHGRVLNHTSVLETINYSIEINTCPNVIVEKCISLRLQPNAEVTFCALWGRDHCGPCPLAATAAVNKQEGLPGLGPPFLFVYFSRPNIFQIELCGCSCIKNCLKSLVKVTDVWLQYRNETNEYILHIKLTTSE